MQAVTLATLTWLDQQARAMLVAKYRLERELAKFRPEVPVSLHSRWVYVSEAGRQNGVRSHLREPPRGGV